MEPTREVGPGNKEYGKHIVEGITSNILCKRNNKNKEGKERRRSTETRSGPSWVAFSPRHVDPEQLQLGITVEYRSFEIGSVYVIHAHVLLVNYC